MEQGDGGEGYRRCRLSNHHRFRTLDPVRDLGSKAIGRSQESSLRIQDGLLHRLPQQPRYPVNHPSSLGDLGQGPINRQADLRLQVPIFG
jgi:hypothetical protein